MIDSFLQDFGVLILPTKIGAIRYTAKSYAHLLSNNDHV